MKKLAFLLVLTMSGLPFFAMAESLNNITLMAVSPLDGQAVIKLPNHKMQVLKVGHYIEGTRAKLTQALSDKIILKEESHQGDSQTVLLHKVKNGVSRIERMQNQNSLSLLLYGLSTQNAKHTLIQS